jgi:RNA polymerase sigma factor (sigma-70 family)
MNSEGDGGLLEAFGTTGDQQAFAELMRRHGGMVLNTARAVVGETGMAEDVSQATFLTLARKAGSLADADCIGGWLHRVAICLARNERAKTQHRMAREREAVMIAEQPHQTSDISEDALSALHEAIGDLPARYRAPIVLHYIEGRTYEEAADELGLNPSAFGVRLMRAREKLRKSLVRHGVAWGTAALVAALGQSASAAELPAGFVASTCAAASGGAVSAKVSALMESALKMLFWAKVKTVAAICAVAVLVAGSGLGVAVTLPLVLKQEAATATRTEPLSPADAWITELLARAEAGPWDVLNLGTGVYSNDVWRMDARGGPAERRIWNVMSGGNDLHQMVIFRDGKRWARGVVVGRMMLLPESQAALEVVGAAPATNMAWHMHNYRVTGAPAAYQKLQIASVSLTCGPPGPEENYNCGILNTAECSAGVWYRFAAYFDTETPDGLRTVKAVWPDENVATPQAAAWASSGDRRYANNKFELGFEAKGVRMVTQGLKFVPLGPDMPLPPKELLERK